MDYTNEAMAQVSGGDQPLKYQPSDIPGFVNPVVDGKADTSQYIPEAQAGQDGAPVLSRDEALKQTKSAAETLYPNGGKA